MAHQTRVEKQHTGRKQEEATDAKHSNTEHNAELKAKEEKVIKDIDDILDEMDGLLEQNAEEFVKSYVQRGGE